GTPRPRSRRKRGGELQGDGNATLARQLPEAAELVALLLHVVGGAAGVHQRVGGLQVGQRLLDELGILLRRRRAYGLQLVRERSQALHERLVVLLDVLRRRD